MSNTSEAPTAKSRRTPWIILAVVVIIGLIVWFIYSVSSGSDDNATSSAESLPQEADITVTEGTNVTASSSPDNSTVIDLHGMLYRVPEGGGEAEKLSDPEHEVARPHVGPDGKIAYQSYDGGNFDIWVSESDGSDSEKITDGYFDYREPRWSPDGKQIVFSSDRDKGSYDIWTIDVASGEFTQWTDDSGDETQPSWSPDGEEIVFVNGNEVATVNPDGDTNTLVADPDPKSPDDEEASEEGITVHAPAMSPDGEHVAWVRHDGDVADLMMDEEPITDGEDVFPFTPSWTGDDQLVYTADGKIRNRTLETDEAEDIPFEASLSIPGADYDKKTHDFDNTGSRQATVLTPQISPDGESVLFVALGDVWHMPIGGEPEQITDDEFHEVDPVFSADGEEIAYASDKAGTQDIYVRSLDSGDETRVTSIDGAEVAPSFSPMVPASLSRIRTEPLTSLIAKTTMFVNWCPRSSVPAVPPGPKTVTRLPWPRSRSSRNASVKVPAKFSLWTSSPANRPSRLPANQTRRSPHVAMTVPSGPRMELSWRTFSTPNCSPWTSMTRGVPTVSRWR